MALAVSTISRQTGSVTTLKQNSSVALMFFKVCFSEPSGLRAMVSEIIGGATHTTVKKLNGARLMAPLGCIELTQAIGLGTIQLLNGSWGRP